MSNNIGFLTTHVLDTAKGQPAAHMSLALYRLEGENRSLLKQCQTNADGRTDAPILPKELFEVGTYELVFQVGSYLDQQEGSAKAERFLNQVPLRFTIDDPSSHYHVPLLVSPFGYSTYRGS